jgi:AraC family transcriptional regulator
MKALANHTLSGPPAERAMVLPLAGSVTSTQIPLDRGHGNHDADQRRWPFHSSEQGSIKSAVSIFPSEGVVRRRAVWRGMAAETVTVTRHGRTEFRFRAPVHLLVMLEAGTRSDGLTFVEGLPAAGLRNYQRKLIFVPAGHEFVDWQETRSLPRVALFYFEQNALPIDAVTPVAPRLFFEDVELWKTALKLKSVVETSNVHDRDYCEALGVVLAHDLARFVSGARCPERQARGGLAGWQQQTVVKYIDERLVEQVSLATLAGLVRLSTYHFSRAFKQSFGMPPHRFHSHRRIERAKALLTNRDTSVTEVGMTLGFSSASSFTMAFRKMAGMTPSDYRRSAI